jgi:hypothetical protein
MALRTFHLLITEDKSLEVMFAFSASVFKERHGGTPGRFASQVGFNLPLLGGWKLHHQERIAHVRFFL